MDLSEEEWKVLNTRFHSAFKKTNGYQGFKSRGEIDEAEGFEVLRELRKVTGDFAIIAKGVNDAVIKFIYDNNDPLAQATSDICDENQAQSSISLRRAPLKLLESRPQREKKAPNKLIESDNPTTVLITAYELDWEHHFFNVAQDQSPLDLEFNNANASNLMDVFAIAAEKILPLDSVKRTVPDVTSKLEFIRYLKEKDGGKKKILAPAMLFDDRGCMSEDSWIRALELDSDMELDPCYTAVWCDLQILNRSTGRYCHELSSLLLYQFSTHHCQSLHPPPRSSIRSIPSMINMHTDILLHLGQDSYVSTTMTA